MLRITSLWLIGRGGPKTIQIIQVIALLLVVHHNWMGKPHCRRNHMLWLQSLENQS